MKAKTCRLCLAVNDKVSSLGNTEAKQFLVFVFKQYDCKQTLHDKHYICYVCKVLLDKTYNFIRRVLTAQQIITDMVQENKKVTMQSLNEIDRKKTGLSLDLTIHQLENIDFYSNKSFQLQHNEVKLLEYVKEEVDIELTTHPEQKEFSNMQTEEHHTDEYNASCMKISICSDEIENVHNPRNDPLDNTKCCRKRKLHPNIDDDPEQQYSTYKKKKRTKQRSNQKVKKKATINYSSITKQRPLVPSKFIQNLQFVGDKRERRRNKKYNFKEDQKIYVSEDESTRVNQNHDSEFELSSICSESSDSDYKYNDRGMRIRTPDRRTYPMTCDHCDYEVPEKRVHYTHYMLNHPNTLYPYENPNRRTMVCHICGKISMTKARHKNHLLTHSEKKKYGCKKCNKFFYNEARLNSHRLTVHTKKLLECDYCGKFFKTRCDLRRHIRIHTGEKPFECHICGVRFALKLYVTSHIRTNHQQTLKRTKKKTSKAPKRKKSNTRKPSSSDDDVPLKAIKEARENNDAPIEETKVELQ